MAPCPHRACGEWTSGPADFKELLDPEEEADEPVLCS